MGLDIGGGFDNIEIGKSVDPDFPHDCIAIGHGIESAKPGTLNVGWGNPPRTIIIHADGKVELPKEWTVEESARRFWEAMESFNPMRRAHDEILLALAVAMENMSPNMLVHYKVGDRVRLRRHNNVAGIVKQVHLFSHNQSGRSYGIELQRVYCGNFEAYNFEVEYDALQQLASEV